VEDIWTKNPVEDRYDFSVEQALESISPTIWPAHSGRPMRVVNVCGARPAGPVYRLSTVCRCHHCQFFSFSSPNYKIQYEFSLISHAISDLFSNTKLFCIFLISLFFFLRRSHGCGPDISNTNVMMRKKKNMKTPSNTSFPDCLEVTHA